jgi:hypothetical protein
MTVVCESKGEWDADYGIYRELWQWAIARMALDYFFEELVQGNVPLTDEEDWWRRRVIPERVTRFSTNWALVFEGLARFRETIEDNVPHPAIHIDPNLHFTYEGKKPLEWKP